MSEDQDIPIVDVNELNQDLPDEYVAQKVADEEGGTGSVYKVTTSSWSAFRGAVMGKGYDIDNHYGWQCWDGAALLWQQFGLGLATGNGLAIGCWDLKRAVNKGTRFDLVTSVGNLKRGDVVVMRPNHIGFFDGFDGAYMKIVGQNQGGKPGPNGGSAFNVVKITKSAFAGAFRLKAWHKEAPEMVTLLQEQLLYRFYLGREVSATGKANVGKKTFASERKRIMESSAYKEIVANASKPTFKEENHLPSAIRAKYNG